MSLKLYPLNDFCVDVTLTDRAGAPITSGSVTAFLSTSKEPSATAADAALSVTATYSGAGGVWNVTIDAAVLTLALLNTHFANATPYLIVQLVGAVRVWQKCKYSTSRKAA